MEVAPQGTKVGNYRWTVCALLFFATTINYLDRQVIGLLKDSLAAEFGWSEKDYSVIVMAFTASYAIGLLGFGRLIDRVGSKLGYSIAVVVWSIAACAHALARSTMGFTVARTALGLSEAGNFPAAIKAVAEWFPKKERALATGILNSGTNVAAMIGPVMIAFIYSQFGWKQAFIWTGLLGFIWLVFWIIYFELPERQKRLGKAEFRHILADPVEQSSGGKVSWTKLITTRQTWTFIIGKFLTDPIWYFYLFWIPSYINNSFGLNLTTSAVHVSAIYVVAGFGSIIGGYLSSALIRRGMEVYRARKTAMLAFAFCVIPVFLVQYASDIWVVVGLISLAAAAHQAWSANIFTTASDMFPKRAVSSVVGMGGMAGSIGGILFPLLVGILLDHYGHLGNIQIGYNIIFTICATAYLLAWFVMHLISPRQEAVVL